MSFKQSNEAFKGDFDILDSLDSEASKRIFVGFLKWRPTLDMALREAGIKNHDIILVDSRRYADAAREDPEIAKLGLSDDEAGAISCYTLQGTANGKSPYQLINEGLAGSRNRIGLGSIGRLLFLLLSGLRKLPRTRPSAGQIFYRGIRAKVPQTRDEANGHQYYEKGRSVTWWGFTSTTTNMEVSYDFIEGAAASTVFHIGGEDLWGYDIKAFSKFVSEDEILLEPEAKVFVNRSKNLGTLLMIEAILQPFNHLALEDIIPVGNVSSFSAPIGQPPAPKTYSGRSFPGIQEKSSFYNQASNMQQKKWDCAWKTCPDDVDEDRKYNVDEGNPRIATKINSEGYCTIIGDTFIPLNTITSWNIKILKSKNNGSDICIGIAPSDINQNFVANFDKCGWYFYCWSSSLVSGPPHNYDAKEYGPRKRDGRYVHTGDSVGVVVDTTRGDLSFVLNGVNLGVAYEGIPLDKPPVPCVLENEGDSVELNFSEVKKNEIDISIPVPSNITAKSDYWDSITLTWDEVSNASFYQIEVDVSKIWGASTKNLFVKGGLFPETEHSFRVRTVRGSSASEWSGVVKGRTLKAPEFSECVWNKCPGDVVDNRKYSLDRRNPRITTKINDDDDFCTIIGNTPIPLNKVTQWNIKILKSKDNNGSDIWIGIAPSDINQNDINNDNNDFGWYFNCYDSTLWSGPPHKYRAKNYGPRKENGDYVHEGDSVGVVMDTTKGDLSFILNGVNLGVAYGGIPLDKPLVPCVLLVNEGDSVELNFSEVKKKVTDFFQISSNVNVKSSTHDSITLIWDEVNNASFYQIEVDGNKPWDTSSTNSFTKRELLPETEHSFRVRAVRGSTLGEWSGVVKGRTLKKAPVLVPVPSNITVKSTTWDSITLTWDKVSNATSYQIEVDGSKSLEPSTTNTFTKRGLLPGTEHSFRVRTMRGSTLSERSGVVKGRTLKKWECAWKKCPDDVYWNRKYSVDGRNPRIARANSKSSCTIIGNTFIPLNTVTSWSIKVLKSKDNNGNDIFIGITPNNINQNVICNYKYGWYFDCYRSTLYSGPPHNYSGKEYGPRKTDGQHVRTGDSVGVVVDTIKGDLSFVLNGKNLGVAYEGIPLDKPLVPCVLNRQGDSVELVV